LCDNTIIANNVIAHWTNNAIQLDSGADNNIGSDNRTINVTTSVSDGGTANSVTATDT
jgi:hypothetical protein